MSNEFWLGFIYGGLSSAIPLLGYMTWAANQRIQEYLASTTSEFVNELGNRIRITIEGPTSTSENVLTPIEASKLLGALANHSGVSASAVEHETAKRFKRLP